MTCLRTRIQTTHETFSFILVSYGTMNVELQNPGKVAQVRARVC